MKTIQTSEVNWRAYNQGRLTCQVLRGDIRKSHNPYQHESREWQSWNYGWNTADATKGLRIVGEERLREMRRFS